jgi:hypothetical protein
MLTGRRPFQSDTPFGYARKHREEEPPPFHAAVPGLDVGAQIEAVVMKAMEKNRDLRFASAVDFAREFARAATAPAEPLKTTIVVPPEEVLAEQEIEAKEKAAAEARAAEEARAARKKAEQEKAAHDKEEAERLAREEAARFAKEQADFKRQADERTERERAERQRLEWESAEARRRARAQEEKERQEREHAEAAAREQERLRAERRAVEKKGAPRSDDVGPYNPKRKVWRFVTAGAAAVLALSLMIWRIAPSNHYHSSVDTPTVQKDEPISTPGTSPGTVDSPAPRVPGPSAGTLSKPAEPTPRTNAAEIQKQVNAAATEGDFYYENGEYDRAIATYQVGLGDDPGNTQLTQKIQKARNAKATENSSAQ